MYNAIYAKFPSELFNIVDAARTVLNFLTKNLAGRYKALGCDVNYPDAGGSEYRKWSKQFTGDAKTKSKGSGWAGKND